MRPLGIGKKPGVYKDPATKWLNKLSKQALVDCVIDLLRPLHGNVDDEVLEAFAQNRLRAVLVMRGDKEPKI